MTPNIQPVQQTEITPPAWAQEWTRKYQSAVSHAFLLHGNVQDYVSGTNGQFLREYLVGCLQSWDIIATWNQGTGLELAKEQRDNLFAEVVELPTPGAIAGASRGLAGGLNTAAGASFDLSKALAGLREPKDAINCINRLMRADQPIKLVYNEETDEDEERPMKFAAIIDYAESFLPNEPSADKSLPVVLAELGRDERIGDSSNVIIMIANDLHSVNEQIRKSGMRWEQIEVPTPDTAERARYFEYLLTEEKPQVQLASGVSYHDLALLTSGLRLIDVKDIVLTASFAHVPLSLELVKQRKDEIVTSEYDEVLTIVDNEYGFESLGGMEEIKHNLYKTVVVPMRAGRKKYVPSGILLMGPAGTGKTRLARALAKEIGGTFVELRPEKVHSKWHGESQRRLERALTVIKSLGRTVVFVDEADQAFGRGENSANEVYNNVFKRLMEEMSNPLIKGEVLWVAATNRPDLLDDALIRPGRLSKKIPVLATDGTERAKILQAITVSMFGDEEELPTPEEYQQLAAHMDGYTGAEIEGVCEKALYLHMDGLCISEAIRVAYDRILPTTRNVDYMTELALANCNDMDLIPAQYQDLARRLHHKDARESARKESEQKSSGPRRAQPRTF